MALSVAPGVAVVFALVAVALVLFVTEAVSPDVTAVGVLVALAVLEPYTEVGATDALLGFANPATLTILAMYVLSDGVQRTGVVERLGAHIGHLTRGDEGRLLGAIVGVTGLSAGVVNNTPVVAVFVPMVKQLADRANVSPSKMLLPLSYAAMLGGTLTLVGTATNLLASDVSARLLDHPIGMFEFTPVGLVVLVVGGAYLLTVAPRLLPERVPALDLLREYGMDDHLHRVMVTSESPLVGRTVAGALSENDPDLDVLHLERNGAPLLARATDREVEMGDHLVVRATEDALDAFVSEYGLRRRYRRRIPAADLSSLAGPWGVVEMLVRPGSRLEGRTVVDARLGDRLDTTVLAVRRGDEVVHEDLAGLELAEGDALLVQTTDYAVEYLQEHGDVVVTDGAENVRAAFHVEEELPSVSDRAPVAVGVLLSVIALAALGVVPIVIAALGGVVAMVVTGCLTTDQAYDAVSWDVIFLLAGVLPLGMAMQRTGAADLLAELLGASAVVLPLVGVMWLFFVVTGLLANAITPVATVVLMAPVAISTASGLGGDPFSFLLTVTFAASTAFMTPVGYQTNLMVYSPGGYHFSDYVRVGAPLQLLLSLVTTLTIAVLFGVRP